MTHKNENPGALAGAAGDRFGKIEPSGQALYIQTSNDLELKLCRIRGLALCAREDADKAPTRDLYLSLLHASDIIADALEFFHWMEREQYVQARLEARQ